MTKPLTIICHNFENNGGGDPAKRRRAAEVWASLHPQLVLRQEMWDADEHGNSLFYEQESRLGLRGWLGQRTCTAIFADPNVFAPLREWDFGPAWKLPPTAVSLRVLPAGPAAIPLNVASYHLNYCSPPGRLAEAGEATGWADKRWTTPQGTVIRMPAIIGGDHNSYPVPRAEGELPLPRAEEITDRPHRAHRFWSTPDGTLTPDTEPDKKLREAGLEDLAYHWATAPHGDSGALAHTVNATVTHGPATRIDRIYATEQLLPAVTGVDVIEVDEDLSDHHIVRAALDVDTLADILHELARA